MKAILLAAGRGERFRPWTLKVPKPCIPFLNLPMMYYPAKILAGAGIGEIVVNVHHLAEQVIARTQSLDLPVKFTISDESKKLLGSGGALVHAKKHLSQTNFIYLNSDAIFFSREKEYIKKLIATHDSERAIATLLVTRKDGVGTLFGGVWLDSKNQVIGIGKAKPKDAVKGLHFCGLQIIHPRIYQYLPEGACDIFESGFIPAMQAGEKVAIHEIKCHWFETGSLSHYMQATADCLRLSQSEYHKKEFEELFAASDSQLTVNDDGIQLCHSTFKLTKQSELHGYCVLGSNAQLGEHCILDNVVVGENVTIAPNCQLSREFLLG